jgi:hypothetical protein
MTHRLPLSRNVANTIRRQIAKSEMGGREADWGVVRKV